MKGASAQDIQATTDGVANCFLETRSLSKSFSGVRVLNDVSVGFRRGEVHAVLGENGAGKSTLMKILAGIHAPDSGEVLMNGTRLALGSAHAALNAGIAMIQQELLPFLHLTVAENIFMGHEPVTRFPGWIDKAAMREQAAALMQRLGIELSPKQKMRELRVAEMQAVEIAKALAHQARVIIMDEPTSALSKREAEALFRIILELRQDGATVIYISHKLEEVFQLADRVSVLRDGAHVATAPVRELSRDRLIALMVGRSVDEAAAGPQVETGAVALSVRGLNKTGKFADVSFDVRRGEVLGLAGLMGAGRSEIVSAIYGLDPADSGEIQVSGRPVIIRKPKDALRAGIGLVTEDRKRFGFVPALGVKQNLTLASLRQWCSAGFIRSESEKRAAEEQVHAFGIKAAHLQQHVEHLSGGNQQKVAIARTLLAGPEILLVDEPTRGIDIAAKAEVHALIRQLARRGKAIVLVSSELPELFSLSDRILVLRQGRVSAEFETRRTTPEEVLKFAMPV